jgi:hypothetical protein
MSVKSGWEEPATNLGVPNQGEADHTVSKGRGILSLVGSLHTRAAQDSSGQHSHGSGLLTHGLRLKQRVLRLGNGTSIGEVIFADDSEALDHLSQSES